MDDTVVVEGDAFAGAQGESHQIPVQLEHLAETDEGRIIIVQHRLRQVEHISHVLADRQARHLAAIVQFDHVLTGAHVVAVMFVAKGTASSLKSPNPPGSAMRKSLAAAIPSANRF